MKYKNTFNKRMEKNKMERLKIFSNIILFLFTGLLITSCENAGDRTDNDMYENEKSALTIRINNTINRIDAKSDELEKRLDNASEENVTKINDQVVKFKERREELREDLRDLKDESDNTWEQFKSDVNEVIDDTEQWINNIDIDFTNDKDTVYNK